MNETGPEATPPTLRGSLDERILDRLIPEPDPPLKIIASVLASFMIDCMESLTLLMKHAEHWGCDLIPTLN